MERGEPIGSLLQRKREGLGHSQYELAELLAKVAGNRGVTRDEVARWERGKRIPGPYWRRWLGQVLSVSVTELEESARVTRRMRRTAPPADPLSAPRTLRRLHLSEAETVRQ